MMEAKERSQTSAELRKSETLSWTAGDSLLVFLKTAETSPSNEHHRIPYPTGIVSRTKFSKWPCLGSLCFGGGRYNVRPEPTLDWLRFHAPWAALGLSIRTLFSHSGPLTVFTLFGSSSRPVSRLCLRKGVATNSLRSVRADLANTLLFEQRELVGVIAERLLSFFSQCHLFLLGQEVCRYRASYTSGAAFCASGQCSFSV